MVKLLLNHNAGINEKNESKERTALHLGKFGKGINISLYLCFFFFKFKATLNGRIEILKLLLQDGADVNATDVHGYTAFDLGKQLFFFKSIN